MRTDQRINGLGHICSGPPVERRAGTDSNNSPARTAGSQGHANYHTGKNQKKRLRNGFGQTVNKSLEIKQLQFSGATASTRGASGHSAFSSAKMAKRALAQVHFMVHKYPKISCNIL